MASGYLADAGSSHFSIKPYLLVEDVALREHLCVVLASQGYDFMVSAEADRIDLSDFQPDVFVVEIDPLNINRLQTVLLLKARFNAIPVLAVAALDDVTWISEGLRCGIADFVFRPVRPVELEARLQLVKMRSVTGEGTRPLIERRQSQHQRGARYCAQCDFRPSFFIDDRTKTVTVQNRTVALSPNEYSLLKLLASDPYRVFSVREIIACIWPGNRSAGAADVQRFIYLLRRRIERDAHDPRWIKTVRGFGYLLDPSGVDCDESP